MGLEFRNLGSAYSASHTGSLGWASVPTFPVFQLVMVLQEEVAILSMGFPHCRDMVPGGGPGYSRI
jgi:hypothetical protein